MRLQIVLYFVWYCLKIRTNPWFYFQVHARFFDEKKWMFSKYDIEQWIPKKWRLKSEKITSTTTITSLLANMSLPVFGKPEWGQNSHGVEYIETKKQLESFIKHAKSSEILNLIQSSSPYEKEFEICFTRDPHNQKKIKIWSFVESSNTRKSRINSIHSGTEYMEYIDTLDLWQLKQLEDYIAHFWDLQLGRVWVKANSIDNVIAWEFHVFEINIFIPLPLKMLAKNVKNSTKNIFLKDFTYALAQLTKQREKTKYKEVFFRKIFLHYKIKISQNRFYQKTKKKLYSWIENTFMDGCSDYNSIDVRRASRSKKQAREMFEKNNIPHAKWVVFINPYTAYTFVKQHWFPVVLKPNVWGYSRGSYFPITNFLDFWKAMFLVKLWWPSSVVETYLLWKNYRVVVTKDSVDIAMQRYPASVIWDNKKTISQLIDEENEVRKSMKLDPIIHIIEKSRIIKSHLRKQSYTLDSVLEKWQEVFLYHRVSLAPGWVLETVDVGTISEKNKKLFLSILDDFDANIFGIDVIMEQGIDTDYDKQKTIFLELNSRPYLKMHTVPRYGKAPDMKPLYEKLDALDIAWKWLF